MFSASANLNDVLDEARAKGCTCVIQGGRVDRWSTICPLHPNLMKDPRWQTKEYLDAPLATEAAR